MSGKQCRPWSDAAYCGVWSGSTLFAKTYLPQYLGLFRYPAAFIWIVYNRAIVYKRHSCPRDYQWPTKSNCALDEIQVTVIYNRAILVAVTSERRVQRGLSVKPGLGHLRHWQTVQIQIRCHRTRRLIMVCSACLNYRKLKVEWNSL